MLLRSVGGSVRVPARIVVDEGKEGHTMKASRTLPPCSPVALVMRRGWDVVLPEIEEVLGLLVQMI